MTSVVARRPAYVRRLGAAALFAATALRGTTTSTLEEPATARAKPKDKRFDREGFQLCVDISGEQFRRGKITEEEYDERILWCCLNYGGEPITR